MNQPVRILYVDDYPLDRELVRDALEKEHGEFKLIEAASRAEFETALAQGGFDLVLSDFNILGFEGLQILETVHATGSNLPVIIVTGTGSEEIAAEAIKRGAADYVIKSTKHIQHLPYTIHTVLDKKRLEDERHLAGEALRESNELLSLFMKHSPIYSSIKEVTPTESRVLMVSENYQAMVGIPASEMVGMTMGKLFPPEFAAKITADDWAVISGGTTLKLDEDLNGRNYTTIKFPLLLGGKKLLASYTIDNTERKQAEAAVEQEKRLLQTVIDNLPDSIYVKDVQGHKILSNPADLEIIGLSESEVIGKTDAEVYPKEVAALLVADDQTVIQNDQPVFNCEEQLTNRLGKKVWLLTSKLPLKDAAGQIVGLVGIGHDITERKQAEQLLRESEERFRSIYENATIGLYRTTPEGRILLCNPALLHMLGYSSFDELAHRNLEDEGYEPGYERGKFKDRIESEEAMHAFESSWARKDGSFIVVSESAKAFRDADGKVMYYEGTVEDITERKQAEAEIQKLNAELERRVEQRTQQLEAANKELEAFAYSVSHDLRAPLRAIDGFSRIIVEDYTDKLDDEGNRLLNVIRTNTSKMDQLISDLLALSRATRLELKFSRIDMAVLANSIYHEVASPEVLQKFGFSVSALPDVQGDATLLRQVWTNLLSNAIKYTLPKEEPRIEVGGYRENEMNVYFVKDNGVGFNPEYTHKLFGVFQRLHKTEDFAGTGVGLAIVQRIILRHGGKVWGEGSLGLGATFYFSLPGITGDQL